MLFLRHNIYFWIGIYKELSSVTENFGYWQFFKGGVTVAPQNPQKRGNFFGPSNFNFDGTIGFVMSKLGSASIFVTIGALEVLFFHEKPKRSHFSYKNFMFFNNLCPNFPKIWLQSMMRALNMFFLRPSSVVWLKQILHFGPNWPFSEGSRLREILESTAIVGTAIVPFFKILLLAQWILWEKCLF